MPKGVYKHKPLSETHKPDCPCVVCKHIRGEEYHHSEKTKRKIGKGSEGRIPWNKDKVGVYFKDTIEKMSEAEKGKTKEEMGHKPNCPCYSCKMARGELVSKNNPNYGGGDNIKGDKNPMKRPELAAKHSECLKELWQTPEYVKNQMKARGVRPNKVELKFNKFLQKFLPSEYKYVGDGEFILAGKCPDFVNVNGQKKIIELYGDYWHRGQTGKDRIVLFKQYGYQTLIIWEKELEDKKSLKDKVLQFNNI